MQQSVQAQVALQRPRPARGAGDGGGERRELGGERARRGVEGHADGPTRAAAPGVDDLQWTKAFRVTWPTDDRHELAPGLVMHRSGGHFPGHSVLHDEHRGILFVGDLLKVDLDGTTPVGLSCHKAFHAQIPLSHAEVRQARALVERLEFEAVATPFEFAAPVSTKQVLALFDRQLAGQPVAHPIPLAELG